MYNNNLYTHIYKGEIKDSIHLVTFLIINNDNNFQIIENTFIAILSYIGSFISIYDIRLWIDILEEVNDFINNNTINIKNVYILITKLCIVCRIYIKNPISKSGIITIPKLREKIIDYFDTNQNNNDYIQQFETVLPPINSENYNIAKIIINSININLYKISNLSNDDQDTIFDLSNTFKNIFEYISRKNYKFETKFNHTDNDSIWFLWGIISKLCSEHNIGFIAFQLFNTNYSKKMKNERIGIIWGMSIVIIYLVKKNISRVWDDDEIILIKKINEIALDLYKQIKIDINKKYNVDTNYDNQPDLTISRNDNDKLNFLSNYIPQINNTPKLEYDNNYENNNKDFDEIRKIKYN